jgi:hypothetical protein
MELHDQNILELEKVDFVVSCQWRLFEMRAIIVSTVKEFPCNQKIVELERETKKESKMLERQEQQLLSKWHCLPF